MLEKAKNVMEQMNAMYADLATLGTNHTAEDEGLTKLGEICCMCIDEDNHKVKDGEDYGYDTYFQISQAMQDCMEGCTRSRMGRITATIPISRFAKQCRIAWKDAQGQGWGGLRLRYLFPDLPSNAGLHGRMHKVKDGEDYGY